MISTMKTKLLFFTIASASDAIERIKFRTN
jgi:hypothetical protein